MHACVCVCVCVWWWWWGVKTDKEGDWISAVRGEKERRPVRCPPIMTEEVTPEALVQLQPRRRWSNQRKTARAREEQFASEIMRHPREREAALVFITSFIPRIPLSLLCVMLFCTNPTQSSDARIQTNINLCSVKLLIPTFSSITKNIFRLQNCLDALQHPSLPQSGCEELRMCYVRPNSA